MFLYGSNMADQEQHDSASHATKFRETAHAHFLSSGRKGRPLGLKLIQLPKRRVSLITLAPLIIKIL